MLSEASKRTSLEFGTASRAGRLIRLALQPMIQRMREKKFTNKLNKKLVEVISTAPGEKGSRRLALGDLALLKGLQLNSYTRFDKLFKTSPTVTIDDIGMLTITLPECKREKVMPKRPVNASEAIIRLLICALDLETGNGKVATAADLVLDLSEPFIGESTIEFPIDQLEERIIITGISLFFSRKGIESANRAYFAAEICDAFLVRDGKLVPFIYPAQEMSLNAEEVKTTQKIGWKVKKASGKR